MNIKKIGLTALAGALVSVSANAAELSVTGGASITFTGQEQADTGNGWSMNDQVTFTGSAEMDNGWTVSTMMRLDNSDGGVFDARSMTIDMGDSGVLTFAGSDGSGVAHPMDDTSPNAKEESWDVIAGVTTHTVGPSGSNLFNYSNSSLMDGLTISAGYIPSASDQVESSTDFALKYTAIEGLTVGMATSENNKTAASVDGTALNATYAMDAFTIGISTSEADSETANADTELTAYGITYAVSDDLSIGINMSDLEHEDATKSDQEAMAIGFSYTMGSMTLSGTHNAVDNVGGAAATDKTGYEIGLAFAF
ncbi:porin [Candidatus Pelagibacter sp.]|nr:porin [Candidatus Pelagibacter sp.]